MESLTRLIGIGYLSVVLILLLLTAVVGPFGDAPLQLPLGPAQTPVEVTIWYGTEKRQWLEEAAQRFAATNPRVGRRPVQLVLRGIGSRESVERIARRDFQADGQPTVVSPASSLWLEVLRAEWAARNPTAATIIAEGPDAPRLLVLTPLVVVAWEERASILWKNGPDDFWHDVHAALANEEGWIGVARARGFAEDSPEYRQARNWGFVKFGHTSPLTSNSGTQALILQAYGYHRKASGLTVADILDPDFQQWLRDIQTAVLEFGDSTGTFMTSMVQFGPSKYDLVVVYENLALENIQAAQGRWGKLRIYYPPATMFSDHPYAILEAPWTTPEQRQAAAQFRDFLLSRPLQELAFKSYGFRPIDPDVPVLTNDPDNPFNKYRDSGAQVAIAQQVETPSAEVIATLLDFWRRQVNR